MMGSSGTVNELTALLKVLADPKATQKKLSEIAERTEAMTKATAAAKAAAAILDKKAAADQEREARLVQREEALADAEANVKKAGEQLSYERLTFESRRDAETSQAQADRKASAAHCEAALKDIEGQRKTLSAEKREHEGWRLSVSAGHEEKARKFGVIEQALVVREKALAAAEADLTRRLDLVRAAAA